MNINENKHEIIEGEKIESFIGTYNFKEFYQMVEEKIIKYAENYHGQCAESVIKIFDNKDLHG